VNAPYVTKINDFHAEELMVMTLEDREDNLVTWPPPSKSLRPSVTLQTLLAGGFGWVQTDHQNINILIPDVPSGI
jgi:hypothetical protein